MSMNMNVTDEDIVNV